MINTSKAYKKAIQKNREFCIEDEVTMSDGTKIVLTTDNIISYSINEATSEVGKFQVGAAVIKEYSATLNNYDGQFDNLQLEGGDVQAKVGLLLEGGTWEKIRKGRYRITKAREKGQAICIKAYDSMLFFDRPYTESMLAYPATIMEIIQDACTCCQMTFDADSVENGNIVVKRRPSDEALTFRDVISYAAQIMGCYAKINYLDSLEFSWYSFGDINIVDAGTMNSRLGENISSGGELPETIEKKSDAGNIGSFGEYHHFFNLRSESINTDNITITGVKAVVETNDIQETKEVMYGQEGYVIVLTENPLVDSENVDLIVHHVGQKLTGNTFCPLTISVPADPAIEAGDFALVTNPRNGKVVQTVITNTTFTMGSSQKVVSSAETPTEKRYTKYSAKAKIESKAKNDADKKLSAYDVAVKQMNQLAANTIGFYATTLRQPDGSFTSYRHDKPELSESKIVYKFSVDGFFVTQNYKGTDDATTAAGQWKAGFDADGNTALNILSVIGINFSWAHGGELKLGGVSNGNGALYVYDEFGRQIGYWTKDGFYAKNGKFEGKLVGATGTFSGELEAASGTFSGSLESADGIFNGTIYGSEILGSSIFAGSFSTTSRDYSSYDSIGIEGASVIFGNQQKITANTIDFYVSELELGLIPWYIMENVDLQLSECASVTMGGETWAIVTNGSENYSMHSMYTKTGEVIFNGFNFYKDVIAKNLYVRGKKSRVASTENYNERTLYCYEMPTPMFGDIGSGRLDENGICYVEIDDIFLETVRCDIEYFVFLQKEGEGDIWVDAKEETFFVVKGTPGISFVWELKAVQKTYETQRLDEFGTDLFLEEDEMPEQIYEMEIKAPDEIEKSYDFEIEEEEAYYE